MASHDHEQLGCERLGKLLFLKLDANLRSLLAVLQQHQEIVEQQSSTSTAKDSTTLIGSSVARPLEREERILGLLRSQVELLQSIQQILQKFPEDAVVVEEMQSSNLTKRQLSTSISILMDYISLPLVAILRRPRTVTLDDNNRMDSEGELEGKHRKLHIRQSAERKSISAAADTLTQCLELVRDISLPHPKIMELILACSSALPTGRQITEQSTSTFHNGGFDRGEAHVGSLLNALLHLLELGRDQAGRFGNEVANAMDGALLAHLADVCVSAVAPPSVSLEATSLLAMETFQKLLDVVPNPSVWRALFPGCFAGFFRTVVGGLRGATRTSQASLKLIQSTLKAFNGLLRLTLRGTGEERLTKRTLADLQRLARSDGAKQTDQRKILGVSTASNRESQQPTTGAAEPDPNEAFLSEINLRLPGPLTVLVKLLQTAESPSIRREGVDLCQVILIQSRSSWDKDVCQDLIILSLESCLILSRDNDEAVVVSAETVLQEYRRTSSSKDDMNRFLSPRLVSMIEELPALAERHSEVELRNQLKLISAFLALNNQSAPESRKRKTCKALQSTLAAEGVFFGVRRSIAKLFDVDFAFASHGQTSSIEVLDQGRLLLDSKPYNNGGNPFPLMFLMAASKKDAITLIHELGRSLGPKHTAILVDGVVADLFNDTVGRVESGCSLTGRSQEAWCHEWIGCLSLVRELLIGAFGSHGEAKGSKKAKHLSLLAVSILPILTTSPLWDLNLNLSHLLDREQIPTRNWENSRALISSSDTFSPMALRGNACFMCGLFQIIEAIFELLKKDAKVLVPTVLPPLLQKATTTKVACVKESARAALERIAINTGFESLGNMIDENMSVVSGSILATLRLPGGRSSFSVDSLPNEILGVASTLHSVLELALHHWSNQNPTVDTKACDKSSLSHVIELVATLTERYDCFASKGSHHSETTLAMVNVYEPAFRSLCFAYRAEEAEAQRSNEQNLSSKHQQPWLEHLTPFRTLEADLVDETLAIDVASPREGFQAYRTRNENEEAANDTGSKGGPSPRLVSNQEVVFVSMLLSRCSFFLSNSSLRLQLESCTAMACGFRFLAIVALISKDNEDNARTAIRRQVNDSWPPIEARLVSLAREIQLSRESTVVVARQVGVPVAHMREMDVSTKRVFLAKLFDLVAIMAQCSEDFIASRFKNDVFPLLSKLLADFAGSSPMPSSRDTASLVATRGQPGPRQASETSLIVSMLRCLAGVFVQPKCGQALRDLIPPAGNLSLPFLGDEAETGTASINALQQLVQIDCDALWRPLVLLSGRRFPPAKPWELTEEEAAKKDDEAEPSTLAQRAKDLVEFIENLPEQTLL